VAQFGSVWVIQVDWKVLYPKTSHPLLAVGLGVRVFARVAENAKSRPMAAVYEMVAGAGFSKAIKKCLYD
jgi:hypothetical protein